MPGGGSKKGERRGGRQVGSLNKKTLEREALLLREAEARRAANAVAEHKAANRKQGREVLYEFMMMFGGMAALYQPNPPTHDRNPNENEERFRTYASLACDQAWRLAHWEAPKFKAIAVPTPVPLPAERPGDDAKVIDINDPVALARVYRRVITASRSGR